MPRQIVVTPQLFPVLGCMPPWIDWQLSMRNQASLSKEITAGINYSIILASACYVEGTFEYILLRMVPLGSEDELTYSQGLFLGKRVESDGIISASDKKYDAMSTV